MLNVWSQPSGYEFLYTYVESGIVKTSVSFPERQVVNLPLPIITGTNLTNLTFTVISGRLPGGLRLTYDTLLSIWTIKGSALEVSRTTKSTFVIRAQNTVTKEISDRTYYMTIAGPDAPVWVTEGWDPADPYVATSNTGQLAIGPVTRRISNLTHVSRANNIATVYTAVPHNFVFGNRISIASSDTTFNAELVEVLQPSVLPNETESEYNTRISTTITYHRSGSNLVKTAATGVATLLNTPLTFVLDNTLVDFQLQAVDNDLSAGQSLEYFIAENDGELPPGLTLSNTGRIYGIVDPIIALDLTAREGFYDSNLFDAYAYDFGTKSNIGTVVTAGNFEIGKTYEIVSLGTTDYTLIGALSNSIGATFTATGIGTGTGTAFLPDENYLNVITPRKLNRNYEFIVSVTDGETISRRRFRIFVVGDDFLRTDNTIVQIGAAAFTADSTYLRAPIWLSGPNLGVKRANNYVTILLETFDPNPAIGPLKYSLATLNPDFTPSTLPDGLFLDSETGEIFGFAPYQPAITKQFTFTINATKYDKEDLTEVEVAIVVADDAPVGQNFIKIAPLPGEDVDLILNDTIRIGPSYYTIVEYISESVTGGTQATLKLKENLLTNVLDGLIITKTYIQSVSVEFSTQTSSKTFTISILGEVDSVIKFLTDSNLGDLRPSYPSNLQVEAVTTVPNAQLRYTLVSGNLPAGLELSETGIIVGKINQFRDNSVSGFTLFDSNTTTFDGNTTTIDRSYKFTVNAQDQFRFSSVDKEFIISVGTKDLTLFSNIYTKPLPKKEKRDLFFSFINDTTIFTPDKIYRLGDPEYGLQSDLKMLVYAGIESKQMAEYVGAISKNIRRKRYRLGSVKKAIAKRNGSNDILYEVIYIDVYDDYESATGSAASRIKLPNNTNSPMKINQTQRNPVNGNLGTYNTSTHGVTYGNGLIENKLNAQAYDRFSPTSTPVTIDSRNVKISGNDLEQVYPSSIKNVRNNLSEVGLTENDFLPLWMTTPQDNRTAATGFVKAIPLCYCKPGEGTYILENIINSGFDFRQLDFEIDRFIIDSDINTVQEKYLKFANHRFNI